MHLRKHQVMKLLYRLKHRNRYPVMQYLWMIAGLNSRKNLSEISIKPKDL